MPRLLPRIAIIFLAAWLIRDVTVDALSIPNSPGAFQPFHELGAIHSTVPRSGTERGLRAIGVDLRTGETVAVQQADGGNPDALKWAAGYWLFPHRVSDVATGASAPDVVIVATTGAEPEALVGYAAFDSVSWAGQRLVAFRKAR